MVRLSALRNMPVIEGKQRLGLLQRKRRNSRLLEELRRCVEEIPKPQAEQIVSLAEQME